MTKTTRRSILAAGAAALALPALLGSPAQAITPAEIKAKGKIVVGIQGDNPPWGFVTSAGKQDGLDADIATLFAKELGVEVEFVPLEVNNRIPALTTGRVDVLFATMAMLPERAKAVQFSKPYVANTIVLIGPKKDKITTNADMAKYTIGVAKGAAQDTQVTCLRANDTGGSNGEGIYWGATSSPGAFALTTAASTALVNCTVAHADGGALAELHLARVGSGATLWAGYVLTVGA